MRSALSKKGFHLYNRPHQPIRLSMITAAKGRHECFKTAVREMWERADNPDQIEHIVASDDDDDETHRFMDEYIASYPDRRIIHRKVTLPEDLPYDQRNIHKHYWNPLAREAAGEIIFGIGNDQSLITTGYDTILLEAARRSKIKHHHGCFQILIDDDGGSNLPEYQKSEQVPFCSMVILTREAVSIFDGIVPEEIVFANGDQTVWGLFDSALLEAHIHLQDAIKTKTVSHHNGESEVDSVTLSHPHAVDDVIGMQKKAYDIKLDFSILHHKKFVDSQLKKFSTEDLSSEEMDRLILESIMRTEVPVFPLDRALCASCRERLADQKQQQDYIPGQDMRVIKRSSK